jgi:hypothetical protein
VERTAGQRRETFLDERGTAVDETRDLGTVRTRATGDGLDLGLVVLPDVRGVRAGHSALLTHPRDRDGGVETT